MKKQTVPRFSVALAMKNKTPFDMTLKVFVSKKINFFEISNCMFKSYCLHQSLPVYYNIQKENYSHRLFCYDVLKSKRIILQSKRGE